MPLKPDTNPPSTLFLSRTTLGTGTAACVFMSLCLCLQACSSLNEVSQIATQATSSGPSVTPIPSVTASPGKQPEPAPTASSTPSPKPTDLIPATPQPTSSQPAATPTQTPVATAVPSPVPTPVAFASVQTIMQKYCSACHSFPSSYADIRQMGPRIRLRVFVQKTMPQLGSAQSRAIQPDERALIARWIDEGMSAQ